ncbi:unnamed protein product [Diabrotica balteata]|uniref:Uncharacterized protein n=1 Tax=Diabrotica balteata TaxID=107213 RepID=A0A9N9XGB0_DIABA|nr:unnamed protein product [Diabrotica balteata]
MFHLDLTSSKRRRRKSEISSSMETEFIELEIRKFCPKRIFDVILINGNDEVSTNTLKNIIETAKSFEMMISLTFIPYADVLNVLQNFDDSVLPDNTKSLINELIDDINKTFNYLKPENYPASRLAMLMKIKLIEVMCRHRKKELEKLEQRSNLNKALEILTKECRKGTKDNHLDVRDKKSLKDVQTSSGFLNTESEVVFDDDIFNHVSFYVFEGVFNVKTLINFVNFTRQSITAVIKFKDDTRPQIDNSQAYSHRRFWADLDDYLYGHVRSEPLENTMLMAYNVNDDNDTAIFEDLWHMIKTISDIKLQHLNYIRHLKMYNKAKEYDYLPLQCLNTYNKIMHNIPLDLSNEVVVLSGILEEVCVRADDSNINDRYSLKDITSKISIPYSARTCVDPRNVEDQYTKPIGNGITRKEAFNFYDKDYLNMTLHMYKPSGKVVQELALNVLKILKPFCLLHYEYQNEELIHKHDLAPSVRTLTSKDYNAIEQFLKLMIIAAIKRKQEQPIEEKKVNETDLICYDSKAYQKSMKILPYDATSTTKFPVDVTFRPSPMDYYWKEKYPPSVMIQTFYEVQQQFAYMDAVYCSEIDRLLLSFHDDLDDFGINTKVYDETICTPVCLRDFCRYIVKSEAKWLKHNEHPTYVRKIDEYEECPGVQKIRKLNIFPEYSDLLETAQESDECLTKIRSYGMPREIDISEDDIILAENNVSDSGICIAKKKQRDIEVTFDEMLSELENYPNNRNLVAECLKSNFSKEFLAYDISGTTYFAVSGARTVFASHDGVKVTVDNTKLVDENSKCTINLQYLENNLILHSHEMFKNFYTFHWLVEDGTKIMFEISKSKKKAVKISESEIYDANSTDTVQKESETSKELDIGKMKVKTLDEEHFRSKLFEDFLRHREASNRDSKTEERYDRNALNKSRESVTADIFEGLNEAVTKNLPVYKVHKDYETLILKKPIVHIPMVNILRRVLHDSNKKEICQTTISKGKSKKYTPTQSSEQTTLIEDAMSFRITLPNGLYVTCYLSQIREKLVEIKQEQLSTDIKALRLEEFRLFTREGYILIKKIDGTITLLMSNGNQINFEKPDTNIEEIRQSTFKQYHCKTLNDYRKKLNKTMKNNGVASAYYISRRAALETRKGYVTDKDLKKVLESSRLPYLKKSLLRFDGSRTVLSHNKIRQKKLYHIVSEEDFVEEEIYFEREDGFKSLLEKSGNRVVEFSDGTRIHTSVDVAPELVDGYVYINLYYKYEHPHYVTVEYEEGDLMRIVMNNDVVLEKKANDDITLSIGKEASTSVTSEEVKFIKKCNDCKSQYTCSFNIAPFHTNTLNFYAEFAHAEDSYQKHFYIDYAGHCKNNASFTSGPINAFNCNHGVRNTYKKLFSLKKTFSGEQFLTDSMVDLLKSQEGSKENTVIEEKKGDGKNNNNLTLQFSTKHYESFSERYLSKSVVRSEVNLTKYKQVTCGPLHYLTKKCLIRMLTTETLVALLTEMQKYFIENKINHNVKDYIDSFANENQGKVSLKSKESLERHAKLLAEEEKKSKLKKHRATFAEKILKWKEECNKYRKLIRMKRCPLYFDSEFYAVNK